MMSIRQFGYASVQKHKFDMFCYAKFSRPFSIFWACGASRDDVALPYVDGHAKFASAEFSDRYAHWHGDNRRITRFAAGR